MWRARLHSKGLLTALEQLERKQREGRHPHALLGGELPLTSLGDGALEFAQVLAATIERGDYRPGRVTPTRALIEGKWRALYQAEPIDMIVNATLASELAPLLEPVFSDRLYSYRQGRSAWQAVDAVVGFLEKHRASHPDPRARGLYVLRRDVRAYGDSIPVSDDSVLWLQLERALQPDSTSSALLRGAVRPLLVGGAGHVTSVPTGSALQPLMCNLYLTPVDDYALTVASGFYARSGDDMIFMHPDASVAREVASEIERILRDLRLTLSDAKTENLYFTGAGRCSAQWRETRGTTQFQYLGARVSFSGGVALKTDRAHQFLQRMRRRVSNTLRLAREESVEQRAAIASSVIRSVLDPKNPQCDRSVPLLLGVINDRQQLRQLDYLIALDVAQRVTGITGARAFRRLTYRSLRRDHGLPSLVVTRHRGTR